MPSAVTAISPFVDKLVRLLNTCGFVPESVTDIEIALREALANAIIHGNHEDRRKHVHVTCDYVPGELSIAVKDEGDGFDINSVPDPTASENLGSAHGRGIHVMKSLMDEVRFDEGGTLAHMRKGVAVAFMPIEDLHERKRN